VHRLLHAVEDVFSSPGFLAAGFAAPGDTQQGEGNKSSPASSDWAVLQELLSSMGMPWHGMDTGAITAVYQVGTPWVVNQEQQLAMLHGV
jgi:hypothetical protein